jgi:TatD DNase family protein
MTDSHTHLVEPQLNDEIPTFLKNFKDIGGTSLLNVGYDHETNLQALKIASEFHYFEGITIKTAIGIHPESFNPNNMNSRRITSFDSMRKLLIEYEKILERNSNSVSAIGETGLDYFRILDDPELSLEQKQTTIQMQKESFRRHVELALKYEKPLTIHTREQTGGNKCIEDTLEILCQSGKGVVRGSLHSYTGDHQYVERILSLGFKIGFNGIITYKNADNVREILAKVPIEEILLETDAPYLPPQQIRSNKKAQFNHGQPSDVLYIAEAIAQTKGIPFDEVVEVTTENYNLTF